ncbi:hypothetical protein SVIOM342S_07822 [Streptomyces violaceorubidus]
MTHRPTGEPLRPVRPHPADALDDTPRYGGPPEPGTVDPAVLTALLHRHGWRRRGGAAGRYGRWTPPGPAADVTSLLVPVSRAFPDSDDLLGEALHALYRSGTPAAREILLSLAVPSDEIRWERDIPTGPGDTASWTAEEQLRSAARRMLLAGALATRARAGYYGARHRRAAGAALENVVVGPAPGGRRLTAFLPVGTGRPLAEAEKRDHRKLGSELDLFSIPEQIGSGLAVFHPKGGIIRRTMEDYSRRRHEEEGYEFVYTPHATKGKLFETSGHLDWYADGMYPPMQLDEGVDYYLKPMNCPMHNLIFDARGRSYRELPLRLFEFGTVYRYEKSPSCTV